MPDGHKRLVLADHLAIRIAIYVAAAYIGNVVAVLLHPFDHGKFHGEEEVLAAWSIEPRREGPVVAHLDRAARIQAAAGPGAARGVSDIEAVTPPVVVRLPGTVVGHEQDIRGARIVGHHER